MHIIMSTSRRLAVVTASLALALVTLTGLTTERAEAASCTSYQYGLGGSGTCVSYIQQMLNGITAFYYPVGQPSSPTCGREISNQKLVVDGQFGTNTDTKVRNFQRWNCITQDGIVGRTTWYHLCRWADQPSFTQYGGEIARAYYAAQSAGC